MVVLNEQRPEEDFALVDDGRVLDECTFVHTEGGDKESKKQVQGRFYKLTCDEFSAIVP